MADGIPITAGTGTTVATDEIGGVHHQRVKISQGADGSATDVSSAAPLQVTLANSAALPAGTANIGDVDVLTVPTDPFGANADAASATGSISAKLKAISTALGITAFDLGKSTGGSRTLRVAIDTSQVAPAGTQYESVTASASDQTIGPTGGTGDYLGYVVVAPQTTSPGVVTIKDNTTVLDCSFIGGATSVSNLIPFVITIGAVSVNGAWKITTGANVKCTAFGTFA